MASMDPQPSPDVQAAEKPPVSAKAPEPAVSQQEDCGCNTPQKPTRTKSQTELKVDDTLPSAEALRQCADLTVFDKDGKERPFKAVVEGDGKWDKNLVIFVRHLFCAVCQSYVSTLSRELPPSALPPDTTITIIGRSYPELIPNYMKVTSSAYPIYCDPSGKLYDALHMTSTLELGDKQPKYMEQKLVPTIWKSITQVLTWKGGMAMHRAGSWSQVGGEFLYLREKGKDAGMGEWAVGWCHRMRNTRDHAEVPRIRRLLCNPGGTGRAISEIKSNGDVVKTKDFANHEAEG